jgi:hypothetical protein
MWLTVLCVVTLAYVGGAVRYIEYSGTACNDSEVTFNYTSYSDSQERDCFTNPYGLSRFVVCVPQNNPLEYMLFVLRWNVSGVINCEIPSDNRMFVYIVQGDELMCFGDFSAACPHRMCKLFYSGWSAWTGTCGNVSRSRDVECLDANFVPCVSPRCPQDPRLQETQSLDACVTPTSSPPFLLLQDDGGPELAELYCDRTLRVCRISSDNLPPYNDAAAFVTKSPFDDGWTLEFAITAVHNISYTAFSQNHIRLIAAGGGYAVIQAKHPSYTAAGIVDHCVLFHFTGANVTVLGLVLQASSNCVSQPMDTAAALVFQGVVRINIVNVTCMGVPMCFFVTGTESIGDLRLSRVALLDAVVRDIYPTSGCWLGHINGNNGAVYSEHMSSSCTITVQYITPALTTDAMALEPVDIASVFSFCDMSHVGSAPPASAKTVPVMRTVLLCYVFFLLVLSTVFFRSTSHSLHTPSLFHSLHMHVSRYPSVSKTSKTN